MGSLLGFGIGASSGGGQAKAAANALNQSSQVGQQAQAQQIQLFNQAMGQEQQDQAKLNAAMLGDQTAANAANLTASKLMKPLISNPLALPGLQTIRTSPLGDLSDINLGKRSLLGM